MPNLSGTNLLFLVSASLPLLLWFLLPDPTRTGLTDPFATIASLGVYKNLSATYLQHPQHDYTRVVVSDTRAIAPPTPDVTVVLLNWKRPSNVFLLVSLLCDPSLDDVVARIIVWNNNPDKHIHHTDFTKAKCTKLQITNNPKNELFRARYIACSKATTEYCFFQDDDYLIHPPTLRTLRSQITSNPIHLLPPLPHLQTSLQGSHAWLGYGTLLPRSLVISFRHLMEDHLKVSEEELKMSDNYFSILRGDSPHTWLAEPIELGDGVGIGEGKEGSDESTVAFSVGEEGEIRNQEYFEKAILRLSALQTIQPAHQFMLPPGQHNYAIKHAPSPYYPYILSTNIQLLPLLPSSTMRKAVQIDPAIQEKYLEHPFSKVVDGLSETTFESPFHGRKNDYIHLDFLTPFQPSLQYKEVQLSILVPNPVAKSLIPHLKIEISSDGDGDKWRAISTPSPPKCLSLPAPSSMQECSFPINSKDKWRYIRARLGKDVDTPWSVADFWVRGVLIVEEAENGGKKEL